MTATVLDAIRRVRTMAQPQTTATFARVNGSVLVGGTSITFDQSVTDVGIVYGSVLTPEDSAERILVMAAATNTASDVVRGHDGTTAVAIADNALVRVNEPLDNKRIFEEMDAEARHLRRKGVLTLTPTTFTYDASVRSYAMPSNTGRVWAVYVSTPDTDDKSWPRLRHWHTQYSQDTTDFTNGTALVVDEPWADGETLRVLYEADVQSDLNEGSLSSILVTAWGIPDSAEALLCLGAACRLLEQEEGRRNQLVLQDDPRAAQQTPPGAFASGVQLMRRTYNDMLRQEVSRVREKFPYLDWEARA